MRYIGFPEHVANCPLVLSDTVQDLPWMSEAMENTNAGIYYIFLYCLSIPIIKFNVCYTL